MLAGKSQTKRVLDKFGFDGRLFNIGSRSSQTNNLMPCAPWSFERIQPVKEGYNKPTRDRMRPNDSPRHYPRAD